MTVEIKSYKNTSFNVDESNLYHGENLVASWPTGGQNLTIRPDSPGFPDFVPGEPGFPLYPLVERVPLREGVLGADMVLRAEE